MSTRAFAYTPGGHVAVVVWPVCVLCALPPADPRVAALYAALSEGATLESSLDLVAMTGISRLPPFAATVLDGDEARVVLHGAARARTSDGTVLEGTALLHESRVTMGSASLQLLIDDEVGLEGAWSIRNGIVAASSIGLTGGTDDAMDSAKRATTASVAGTGALPRRDAEAQATAGPGAPVAEAPMAAEQAVPAPDDAEEGSGPSGFDHLFGETIGLAPAAEEQPAAGQEPVQHHQSLGETQIGAPTVGLAEVGELAAGVASGLVEHPPAPAPGTGQGFIAAFDWRGASWPPPNPSTRQAGPPPVPSAEPPVVPPPPPVPQPPPSPTVAGPVVAPPQPQPAPAVPVPTFVAAPSPPAPEPAASPLEDADDMGGHTIRRSRLPATGEMVTAVVCPAGHLNPQFAELCRLCRAPIAPQTPRQVVRPSLGVLRLSNGVVLNLDRGAVLGRNPRPVPGVEGPPPSLVRISDPTRDVSSQHLEVRLEGWFVTVRDLNSTNGTEVALPGRPPVTLRAGEPFTIEPGTKVMLASAFEFTFEAGS